MADKGRLPITIEFKNGFTVRPAAVSALGELEFTDGTINLKPNQLQCEAYGYTYDPVSRSCIAFNYNSNLDSSFNNIDNSTKGIGNEVGTGVSNICVYGQDNIVNNRTRNSIIIGTNNEIANRVNNANVFGTFGEATADNSIVLGGNASGDILGERQSIQLMYGKQTTDGNTKASNLNNTVQSYFQIPINTVIYFHADVVAVRVGGTHATGAAGDCASWVERGVAINKNGVLSIARERDTIKSIGTVTNWRPTAVVSGTSFGINVRGHVDMTVEWCSNIRLTQIKTGVTL